MDERTPLGIEGASTTKASPVGIAILVIIIILAVVAVYYYSPGLYEPKNEEGQEITATFNDIYLEQTVDSDADGCYDYLNISVGINVSESGEYSVDGSLHVDGNKLYASNTAYLYPNNQTIILFFNGLDIYLCRVNDSYQLRNLTLKLIKGNTSFKMGYREYAYNTSLYNYTSFQSSTKVEYIDTIQGSSQEPTTETITRGSFKVKETAIWITVTVNYNIEKAIPFAPDSYMNLYIYSPLSNESIANNTDEENPKMMTFDADQIEDIGYGTWTALVHHYSDTATLNTASYTLTIDVVYE